MTSTTPPPPIHTHAASFVQSYARAVNPPIHRSTVDGKGRKKEEGEKIQDVITSRGEAISSHYLPNFTTFALGGIVTFPTHEVALAAVTNHLTRLEESGVGIDVRLVDSRVEVTGSGSALCWVRWGFWPKEGFKNKKGGSEGWEYDNVYFYRRFPDGREGWEGGSSDGELEGLDEHIEGYVEGLLSSTK